MPMGDAPVAAFFRDSVSAQPIEYGQSEIAGLIAGATAGDFALQVRWAGCRPGWRRGAAAEENRDFSVTPLGPADGGLGTHPERADEVRLLAWTPRAAAVRPGCAPAFPGTNVTMQARGRLRPCRGRGTVSIFATLCCECQLLKIRLAFDEMKNY